MPTGILIAIIGVALSSIIVIWNCYLFLWVAAISDELPAKATRPRQWLLLALFGQQAVIMQQLERRAGVDRWHMPTLVMSGLITMFLPYSPFWRIGELWGHAAKYITLVVLSWHVISLAFADILLQWGFKRS